MEEQNTVRPDDYTPSGPFTVRTVAGEEIEIVSKIPGEQRIILVTAEDQKYVGTEGGLVEGYDPEKHGQGTVATGEAAADWAPAADATEAADARAAHEAPKDATDAANAEAALEQTLAQSKTLAEEQPEGSDVKGMPEQPLPVPQPESPPKSTPPPPPEGEPTGTEEEPTPPVDGATEGS